MEMEVWSGLPLSEAGQSCRRSMRHSSEKANEKAEKKNSGTMRTANQLQWQVEHRGKKRVKFMADHHGTQDQTGKMRQRTQGNLKLN